MITLNVNGKGVDVDVEPETPLLWVLRDSLGMTGTKFGCGAGLCGACTVHVNGQVIRSCMIAAGQLQGKTIATIESIAADPNHPVIAAWIDEQVPQCGYCQSGQIMAATALLQRNPHPSDADIDREMTNICRCGTYANIRTAIRKAAELMAKG
jgi:aerobic-type carbon monoxide dehydrogenase small subunit (CoxS/CutS family)